MLPSKSRCSLPDIWKIKDALFRKVKFNWPYVKFYNGDQGNRSEQGKIDDDQDATGPAISQFMNFYVEKTKHRINCWLRLGIAVPGSFSA